MALEFDVNILKVLKLVQKYISSLSIYLEKKKEHNLLHGLIHKGQVLSGLVSIQELNNKFIQFIFVLVIIATNF